LLLPFILAKAWRWNFLMKRQNIHYSLKDSFLIYSVGTSLGMLTPGRLGDLIKVIYLKNDRYSLGRSLTNVVLDRLFDIFFIFIFGYVGMLFFLQVFLKQILISSIVISASLLILYFLIRLKLHRALMVKIFYLFVPPKYQKSWKLNFQDFILGIKAYTKKDYAYAFLMTVFSWLIYYLISYSLALSLGLTTIPILYFVVSVTISALIAIIPISVFGLGTREATLIFLFSFFGISKELSIAFSLLTFSLILFTGLIGTISWLIKPLKSFK